MERGASYSLHEDSEHQQQAKPSYDASAVLMQSASGYSLNGSSGYQPPPQGLHHRTVSMQTTTQRTGRIIDRADTPFLRSKGRWKYVCVCMCMCFCLAMR